MSEIWWVNHYAITPDLPGGTRHYDLAVELVRRGFTVKVFAAADSNLLLRRQSKLPPGQLYTVEVRDGVQFVWVRAADYQKNNWRRAWNMVSFSRNFSKVASQIGSRPVAVIGSSPHPFAALAAERVAARYGAQVLLELRDLWPQALVDMGGLSEWHPGVMAMRVLERYLYRRADQLVILAKGSQRYLAERGVEPSRTLFVPNGVHLGHFQPTMTRQQARAHYGFNRFTVVYAGAHGPANSLGTIVQAAKMSLDIPVDFVLVGDGPAKSGLMEMASGVPNVHFREPVPKTEIADLLHGADAGVITLKNAKTFAYGVSPNKLFDYMGSARPVLCSVPGDMADIVRESGAGLVCRPEDPVALSEAVRQLVSLSEDERQRLGENGYQYLSKHFRREILAERLASIIRVPPGLKPMAEDLGEGCERS